jgi:hypothetical protein
MQTINVELKVSKCLIIKAVLTALPYKGAKSRK